MEEWKIINETQGRYEVSNHGRVGHIRTGNILKPRDNGKGYKNIVFRDIQTNKLKYLYIHRLVSKYFIDNPDDYKEINHKDENKANNHVSNLEWCTRQYNNTYGSLTKNKMKKVKQHALDGRYIKTHNSIIEAENELGIRNSHIGNACQGKRKSCSGYKWEYA